METETVRVKAGKYMDGGKMYRRGDLVQSDKDLARRFPEKFERITAPRPEDRKPGESLKEYAARIAELAEAEE